MSKLKYKIAGDRTRVVSNPGAPIKEVFSGKYDKYGTVIVDKVGEQNLYDYIQSFADSVDINLLLAKFVNGDTSALNQRNGAYLDITQFPTNYAELLNTVIAGQNMFDELPIEVKRKFDNDVNQFISTIGTDDWFNKLSDVNSKDDFVTSDAPKEDKGINIPDKEKEV